MVAQGKNHPLGHLEGVAAAGVVQQLLGNAPVGVLNLRKELLEVAALRLVLRQEAPLNQSFVHLVAGALVPSDALALTDELLSVGLTHQNHIVV